MNLDAELMYRIYLQAALEYNRVLNSESPDGQTARTYISSRGITLSLANKFLVGFAPRNRDRNFMYKRMMERDEFDVLDLLRSRIVKVERETGIVKDYFGSQRVIFPSIVNGKLVCISARTVVNGVEPKFKTLKYQSNGIFNADVVRDNIDRLYIAEGAIDTLSLIQMGFPTIGIFGLQAINKEDLLLLTEYKKDIIICFDNDANGSGAKGVKRIGNILHSVGARNIYYKVLPRDDSESKMDINSFMMKHGPHKATSLFAKVVCLPFVPDEETRQIEYSGNSNDKDINLLDLVMRYSSRMRNQGGGRYSCVCPLPGHKDNNPSFVIYPDNKFKCFGCGEYGGPAKFMMLMNNIGYREAMQMMEELI